MSNTESLSFGLTAHQARAKYGDDIKKMNNVSCGYCNSKSFFNEELKTVAFKIVCASCGHIIENWHSAIPNVGKMNEKEPMPEKNDHPYVWDLVKKDIEERDEIGFKKYGTRLQPFNGRKSLVDAYQDALDLVVYLRQAIFEMDNKVVFDPNKINSLNIGMGEK